MMQSFLTLTLATLLFGQVVHDNRFGRIGIRWHPGKGHKIEKVCHNSPADIAGLLVGDIISDYDDDHVYGEPYTEVNLTINRNGQVLYFRVLRIPAGDIND